MFSFHKTFITQIVHVLSDKSIAITIDSFLSFCLTFQLIGIIAKPFTAHSNIAMYPSKPNDVLYYNISIHYIISSSSHFSFHSTLWVAAASGCSTPQPLLCLFFSNICHLHILICIVIPLPLWASSLFPGILSPITFQPM